MAEARAIAPDLFEQTATGIRLIGGRRRSDGRLAFPLPGGAERRDWEPVLLSAEGTLWSWTVQRFRPQAPPYAGPEGDGAFRPFCLGYVELPGELIVEARLDAEPGQLAIGQTMAAVAIPFATDPDGTQIVTYGFRPVGAAAGAAP